MRIVTIDQDCAVRDDEIVGVDRQGDRVVVMLRGREWAVVRQMESEEQAIQLFRNVMVRWRGLGST